MYEVENALKSIESYIILLKGAPGTGKTTYAMTLLEQLCQEDAKAKGVYISTRIDPAVLYKQFPSLEKHVPRKNIIDATQSEFSNAQFQVLYEDSSSFFRAVYSLVAEEDVTLLIVDSWDAVSFQVGKENQSIEKLENTMLDIARKTKTHLLLITEYTGEKKLDYLVDGILRLEKEQIDDKTVRRVFIDKLRGFQVPHNNYPFTLEAGKFTHFITTATELGSGWHKVIKNREKEIQGTYSTGIKDLDTIIGGYPRGSFVLLEIADGSISQSYRPVLFHTISNFMLNNCGVIYMPEECSYSSSVKKLLSDYVSEEVLDANLRMPTISEPESGDPCLFKINADGKGEKESESLKEYLAKHLEVYKGLKKPVLHVLGLTRLDIYSEDDIRGMFSEMVAWVRTTDDVLIGVLKPSAKLKNEIREMADIHLKFIPINGTINVYGVKPHTLLYNIASLSVTAKKEYHQLKLTPFL